MSSNALRLLRQMRTPIATGHQLSSWYWERTDVGAFPSYLLSYAGEHEAMLAHHQKSLWQLKEVLGRGDKGTDGALVRWATEAANEALDLMPEDSARLLRVHYLHLLAQTMKLSSTEKQHLHAALSPSTLSPSHQQELYHRFTSEYHAVKNVQDRMAVLGECRPEFVMDMLGTGWAEMQEAIELFVPGVRKEPELFHRAVATWNSAIQDLFPTGDTDIPASEHVSRINKLYKQRVYQMHSSKKEKEAMRQVGRFIASHANDTWEIRLFFNDLSKE